METQQNSMAAEGFSSLKRVMFVTSFSIFFYLLSELLSFMKSLSLFGIDDTLWYYPEGFYVTSLIILFAIPIVVLIIFLIKDRTIFIFSFLVWIIILMIGFSSSYNFIKTAWPSFCGRQLTKPLTPFAQEYCSTNKISNTLLLKFSLNNFLGIGASKEGSLFRNVIYPAVGTTVDDGYGGKKINDDPYSVPNEDVSQYIEKMKNASMVYLANNSIPTKVECTYSVDKNIYNQYVKNPKEPTGAYSEVQGVTRYFNQMGEGEFSLSFDAQSKDTSTNLSSICLSVITNEKIIAKNRDGGKGFDGCPYNFKLANKDIYLMFRNGSSKEEDCLDYLEINISSSVKLEKYSLQGLK